MKNKLIILFTIMLVACGTDKPSTDIKDHAATIKTQAQTMGDLLLKKDYKGFRKYIHPKVIELMGGEASMIDVLGNSASDMEAAGTSFSKVSYGEPTAIIVEGNEFQCTISQTTEIQTPDGTMVVESTLIAISQDGGKNWFFVDTSGQDIQTMKKTLANLSAQLVIPPQKEPTYK